MRPKLLILSSLIACAAVAFPQAPPDPGDLLQRVTKKVLDTVGRLPKYLCTQTIDRSQFEPTVGAAAHHCEPSPRNQSRLTTSDRLRLDVAVSASREMYSWVGESRFEDGSLFDLVRSGALSTGSFASFLMVVFRDDEASFSYKGETSEAGRKLAEFEFSVPKQSSHYTFAGAGARAITGYFGSILVDPKTADLVRLVVHTEGLPPETGSCESSSTLDYTRVRLNNADFLLPSRVQLHILDANGVDLENSAIYSGCHEFLGESTLHFDSGPETGMNPEGKAEAAGGLPAKLSFTIALNNDIDQTTAAAGDKLTAKLTAAVSAVKGQVLIPKGAVVTARILQIRRFYLPEPSVRLVLKLETVEIAGAPHTLSARPVPDAQLPALNKSALQRRPSAITMQLDNQDSQAAVFIFRNTKSPSVATAGYESNWQTVQPLP